MKRPNQASANRMPFAMRALILSALFLCGGALSAHAQPAPTERQVRPNEIVLRPAPRRAQPEQWMVNPRGYRSVRNVVTPTLEPFLPDPAIATGAAVIVAPGGGFETLEIDNEGYPVAQWLADHGIAAFVLKYRLRPTPREHQDFMAALQARYTRMAASANAPAPTPSPAPDRNEALNNALEDAQAAVRLVRARAEEWHVDPARVGFVGFSAGAFTALAVGLDDDRDARPDFIAPIYGSMAAREIPSDAPPMFYAVALDDQLMVRDTDFGLIRSYREANRPVEAHFYSSGAHGFGMQRKTPNSAMWIDAFHAWMQDLGVVPTPQP